MLGFPAEVALDGHVMGASVPFRPLASASISEWNLPGNEVDESLLCPRPIGRPGSRASRAWMVSLRMASKLAWTCASVVAHEVGG